MDKVEEFLEFLKSNRPDVRKQASKDVLDLTGTDGGIVLLNSAETHDSLALLSRLLGDQDEIALNAAKALVNMSSNERAKSSLLEKSSFWASILETLSELGKAINSPKTIPERFLVCVKLLNNVTTSVFGAERLLEGRLGEKYRGLDVQNLILFWLKRPDELAEIALVITNVTQLDDGRDLVLNKNEPFLSGVFRMMESPFASTRKACVETVRNCCLNNLDAQLFLLASMGLCERLLKPLLGQEGIADPDDFDELPIFLKRAIEDADKNFVEKHVEKERESDPEVRRLIIDVLLLVAQHRSCREILRVKKTYAVIKAYHPTEDNEETSDLIFDLVDLLLGEEEGKPDLDGKPVPKIVEILPEEIQQSHKHEEEDLVESPEDEENSKSVLYEID